jgi:hypothetical protein
MMYCIVEYCIVYGIIRWRIRVVRMYGVVDDKVEFAVEAEKSIKNASI